ncbi:MAG TPA: S8 family serine peptidase [Ktedonobacteraceae bacterium]
MNMTMGNVVYWHKNQVIVRARAKQAQAGESARNGQAGFTLDDILGIIWGKSANMQQIPQPFDAIPLLPVAPSAGDTAAGQVNDWLLFYYIDPDTLDLIGAMQRSHAAATMDTVDATLAAIEKLKADPALKQRAVDAGCALDSIPHWLWTATDDESHGCPVNPPIPVEDAGEAGHWKLAFHRLADRSLYTKIGEGVMVFVLDTLPALDQLKSAAKFAPDNMLLQSMTHGIPPEPQSDVAPPAIKPNYDYDDYVPDPSESAKTGKDIYGRLVGFPMADHGIAVAGIIRDLAPAAEIECIRVLNDYGVGDVRTLCRALEDIKKRMNDKTDLASKPVVVNLSLVVMPPGNGIPDGVTDNIMQQTKDALHRDLHDLAKMGAVITASAGNDSDPRDTYMNPAEIHFGPRYPAAFAYEDPPVTTMIPVGAVNQKGEPAMYSNHPGPLGIATYAGELTRPDPWLPSAMSHAVTQVVGPIDALRCVYTSTLYPALSVNDLPRADSPDYPMYEVSSSWAYWLGTSFATPIISALAARILQGHGSKDIDVRQAILDVAAQETLWRRVGDEKEDIRGPLIMATQEWQTDDNDNQA